MDAATITPARSGSTSGGFHITSRRRSGLNAWRDCAECRGRGRRDVIGTIRLSLRYYKRGRWAPQKGRSFWNGFQEAALIVPFLLVCGSTRQPPNCIVRLRILL